jgi:hypothetical protein
LARGLGECVRGGHPSFAGQDAGLRSHQYFVASSCCEAQQTQPEIHERLQALRELDLTSASLYVLCPMPGAEQYDDFMARERNLEILAWCAGRRRSS